MTGTSCNAWNEGFETQTDYGAPTKLVTVTHALAQQSGCLNNPHVASVTTTYVVPNVVSERTFTYDPYDNVNEEKDYDWGSGAPGPLLRDITYGYLWQTNSNYTNPSSYLVSAPFVMDVWDANHNHIAETVWHYDENPLQDDPGIVGHDPAYGTGFTYRANLTSLWKWLSSTGQFLPQRLMTYDIAGNPVTVKDGNGNQTSFSYSDNYSDGQYRATFAHVTAVTNALGQSPYQANYDFGTGQPELMADIMGQYRTRNYGSSGYAMDRLVQINYANGAHTYYSYPSATEVVTQQDQNSSGDGALKSQTISDGLGRATESDSFESASQYIDTTTQYDAMGRVHETTNPSRPGDNLNASTTYTYDGLGRVTEIQTPDGAATHISYWGNAEWVTDPAGKVKQYTYDALGRLINVREDPNGVNLTTDYQYDTLGDLTLVSQGYCPNCEQRHFTYDSLGRLVSASNPESGTVSYTYDWSNNLVSKTDARGVKTTYTYDGLNRLTGKSYSDGTPAVTYTYGTAGTATGHLVQVHNGNSTTNFTSFDVVGNLLASNQVTAGETYSFAYGYNLAGALTSETYPSGRVVTTTRDGADRPYALSGVLGGQTTNYITQTSYWPSGGVYFFIRGNNVWHAASFNNRLQQTESYEAVGNNNSVGSMLLVSCPNWGVNDNHNLYDICLHASATNDNGTLQSYTAYIGGPGYSQYLSFSETFGHDSLNRLTSASDSGGWSRSFGYDTWGNMWVTGAGGVALPGNTPTSDVYNGANRINGASYDAAGNDLGVNGDTLTYDAENRMTSAYDNVSHNTESYLYDGDGQRVEKSGPAGTIVYVYDGFGQLASEYSSTPVNPPCTTCYLSYDHLGSVRLVTDQNGNVVARHGFLPFGQEIPANTAGRNGQWGLTTDAEQKFTSQIRDTETGMDFFHARYFDAPLGRFNSPDPANAGADMTDPQTWNAYAYVRNNPLSTVDQTGMDACDPSNNSNCVPDPDTDPGDYARWVEQRYPESDPMQGNCIVDGAQVSCGMAANILDEGAGALCPDSGCEGFGTDPYTHKPAFLQFSVGAGGTSGYLSLSDWMQGVNEWNGHFLSDQQFQQQVIAPGIASQKEALATAIAGALNISIHAAYSSLQYVETVGSNSDFRTSLDLSSILNKADRFRYGLAPSIHEHTRDQLVHLDTMNPYKRPPAGLLTHVVIDVILGHINGSIPYTR